MQPRYRPHYPNPLELPFSPGSTIQRGPSTFLYFRPGSVGIMASQYCSSISVLGCIADQAFCHLKQGTACWLFRLARSASRCPLAKHLLPFRALSIHQPLHMDLFGCSGHSLDVFQLCPHRWNVPPPPENPSAFLRRTKFPVPVTVHARILAFGFAYQPGSWFATSSSRCRASAAHDGRLSDKHRRIRYSMALASSWPCIYSFTPSGVFQRSS